MRETGALKEMIFAPEEEGAAIKALLSLLEKTNFNSDVLEEVYNQLREDGVEAAAKLIFEKFGSNLQQPPASAQPQQA